MVEEQGADSITELELRIKPFELYALRRRGYVANRFIHEGMQGRVFSARAVEEDAAEISVSGRKGMHGRVMGLSASASCQTVNSPWERAFAVKIMSSYKTASWAEVEALQRLQDTPGVLQMVEFFESGDDLFLLTEFLEGGDLLDLAKSNVLGYMESLQMARKVLEIICALHQENVAHRDIKLENFMLVRRWLPEVESEESFRLPEVKAIDFGLAKHVSNRRAKLTGDWCGTVCYCAPELVESEPYRPMESDVWSFGVLLYVLLTKKFPFGTDADMRTRERIVNNPVPLRDSEACDSWPAELKGLILCLLDKNPSRRPSAARALRLLDVVLNREELADTDEALFLNSIARDAADASMQAEAGAAERTARHKSFRHLHMDDSVNATAQGMFNAMTAAMHR